MVRMMRLLALVAILGVPGAEVWAQSTHVCSQSSNCLASDNSSIKSTDTQSIILPQAFAISNAVVTRMNGSSDGGPFALVSPGITGMAAGAVARTSNIWASYGNVSAGSGQAGSNFGATINNYTVGYDYAFSTRLVAGLSLAYSDNRGTTNFNNGSFNGDSTVAAPYLSYELDKHWSIDASAGWGSGHQTTKTFGSQATGGVDRNFAAANLNGIYWFGLGQLATRFSLLNANEKLNSYTLGGVFVPDVKNRLTQAAAMARYGYWFDGIMPYASLTFTSDLDRTVNPVFQAPGRNAWIPKIGVDLFSKRGISGGVSYSSEQGRSGSVKNDVFLANVSFRF
ncbi:MAG TPA: autotransporter outer membrane beta-barrel domain-containing protein [Burkholderiales bacterium]|nr:autotransporter outer membrane beta-barrel domain-containing protein [Burkholderiales bacterium]